MWHSKGFEYDLTSPATGLALDFNKSDGNENQKGTTQAILFLTDRRRNTRRNTNTSTQNSINRLEKVQRSKG